MAARAVLLALWAIGSATCWAEDGLSQEDLLALAALELLQGGLAQPADLTLNPLLDRAAGSVFYGRIEARTALHQLIGRILAGQWPQRQRAIEDRVKPYTRVAPDTLAHFTRLVLESLQEPLARRQDAFLDDILADAAVELGLPDQQGFALGRLLSRAAARQLRPQPPADIAAATPGRYVLAVHFQFSKPSRFRGLDVGRLSPETIAAGTRYLGARLQRSITMRRRFRNIVPCFDLSQCENLVADYLLVLDIENQQWQSTTAGTLLLAQSICRLPDRLPVWKHSAEVEFALAEGAPYQLNTLLDPVVSRLLRDLPSAPKR